MVYIRRLVKAGQTSHTISLPKKWLEKHQLKRGDSVYLQEEANQINILPTLSEPAKEQKEITISTDNKSDDTLQREITAAYVNNFSTIILLGEEVQERQKQIRRMLHDFVALEIAEQGPKKIIAKDFLNLNEISVEKTIKRADMIVRTMLLDTIETLKGKELAESVKYRDYDVNRIYFLLTRLFKNSLQDKGFAERLKLDNVSVLSHWMLMINIENAADSIKRICESKTKSKEFISLVDELEKDYSEIMKAYHTKDKHLADTIAQKREDRESTCTKIASNQPQLIATAEQCKNLLNSINAIARLVIDS